MHTCRFNGHSQLNLGFFLVFIHSFTFSILIGQAKTLLK